MKVSELIDLLGDFDPDAEVRVATQPTYPLQSHLRGVAGSDDLSGETQCERHEHYNCDDPECVGEPIVWLVEGSQHSDSPYAPRALWDVVRSA